MAALTLYATNTIVSVHQELSETSPGANATSSPRTGWVVGTGATNHSELAAGTVRESTTFTGTTVPDGSIDTTLGDCLRSANAYTGTFASANWTITFSVIGVTQSGAQDGRMRCRLLRSTNADGSGATEITSAQQQGGLVTNLSTTQQDSAVTFNPGSFSLTNEYIFIQIAWERTGAGGMTSTNVVMRIGTTATRVVTSNFAVTYSYTIDDPAIDVTDAVVRNAEFARVSNDTVSVTDSVQADRTRDPISKVIDDTLSTTDSVLADGDFPILTGRALSFFTVAPYPSPPSWPGRDSTGGTSFLRDLATAGNDPDQGSTYAGRKSAAYDPTVNREITGYDDTHHDAYSIVYATSTTSAAAAQSILGTGEAVASVLFNLRRNGSPTGSVLAKIFACSGAYDASGSVPTGSALATSEPLDITTVPPNPGVGGFQMMRLTFATPFVLTNGVSYCVSIEYAAGTSSVDCLHVSSDSVAIAPAPTYPGFMSHLNAGTGVWTNVTNDLIFSLERTAHRLDFKSSAGVALTLADVFGTSNYSFIVVFKPTSIASAEGTDLRLGDSILQDDGGRLSLSLSTSGGNKVWLVHHDGAVKKIGASVSTGTEYAAHGRYDASTDTLEFGVNGTWQTALTGVGDFGSTTGALRTGVTYAEALGGKNANVEILAIIVAKTKWTDTEFTQARGELETAFGVNLGSGAGTTLDVAVDDTASVTDTSTRTTSFERSGSDSISVSETITRALDYGRGSNDVVVVTDQGIRSSEFGRVASDNVVVTDQGVFAAVYGRSVSDNVIVTDAGSRNVEFGRVSLDSANVTDNGSASREFGRENNDTVTTTDVSNSGLERARTIDDTATVTDQVTRVHDAARFVSDSVNVTDQGNTSSEFARTTSDTVSAADQASKSLEYVRTSQDAIAVTDQANRSLEVGRVSSDAVTVTDTSSRNVGFERLASDAVSVTDNATRQVAYVRFVDDTVILTDDASADFAGVVQAVIIDVVGVTDQASRELQLARVQSDAVSATDAGLRSLETGRITSDAVSVADQTTWTRERERVASDTVSMTDSATPSVFYVRVVADTVFITDITSREETFNRTATDAVSITDSAQGDKSGVIDSVVSDTIGVTDQVISSREMSRTVSDAIAALDNALRELSLHRAVEELVDVIDVLRIEASYERRIVDAIDVLDDISFQIFQLPVAIVMRGTAFIHIERSESTLRITRSRSQVAIDQSSIATVIIKKGTP